ncbi:hypothetical protein WMY93_014463 [Mugilogobius chulae]|uniref:Uncharacterized protein n=1 Tax=Mugilogobius chulae TaxID=88201 RepID=A0AAW0NVL9_9GOBI
MPPLNKRRLAAKRRMKALRLRYPNGLWNPPVDLPVEPEQEQIVDVEKALQEGEIIKIKIGDEIIKEAFEDFKKETETTETIEVPGELVEEMIEEIQVDAEETCYIIQNEMPDEESQVPEISQADLDRLLSS